MAGCLPTKTSIRLKSSNGEHTDVPAATRSTAGVMSADHVARLEAVEQTLHAGDPGQIIIPPARMDGVTRSELATALVQLKSALQQDVGRVLSDLRTVPAITNAAAQAPISIDTARLENLERVVVELSERLTNLEQTVGHIGHAFESAVEIRGAAA